MVNIIVAGIGTEVGKTVVSAILTKLLKGDYWKPIQSGAIDTDSQVVAKLLSSSSHTVYPPAYSFKAPLSPHHAARLENQTIDPRQIIPPQTNRSLIIEMVGGIFVPLNEDLLSVDLFKSWNARWVLVSKHYLGSINHTLLTIKTLKAMKIPVLGIIFNGDANPDSEKSILNFSKISCLARLFPEEIMSSSTIQRYTNQWEQSGTLSLK